MSSFQAALSEIKTHQSKSNQQSVVDITPIVASNFPAKACIPGVRDFHVRANTHSSSGGAGFGVEILSPSDKVFELKDNIMAKTSHIQDLRTDYLTLGTKATSQGQLTNRSGIVETGDKILSGESNFQKALNEMVTNSKRQTTAQGKESLIREQLNTKVSDWAEAIQDQAILSNYTSKQGSVKQLNLSHELETQQTQKTLVKKVDGAIYCSDTNSDGEPIVAAETDEISLF